MGYEQRDGGAFWWAKDRNTGEEKRTKNGDKYMTGKITLNGTTVDAVLFYQKPEGKKNPNAPDISISINSQQRNSPAVNAVKERMEGIQPPPREEQEEIRVEDIPF